MITGYTKTSCMGALAQGTRTVHYHDRELIKMAAYQEITQDFS